MATPSGLSTSFNSDSLSENKNESKNVQMSLEEEEDKKQIDKKEGEFGGLSLDEVTGNLKIVSKDKKEYDVERKNLFISTVQAWLNSAPPNLAKGEELVRISLTMP